MSTTPVTIVQLRTQGVIRLKWMTYACRQQLTSLILGQWTTPARISITRITQLISSLSNLPTLVPSLRSHSPIRNNQCDIVQVLWYQGIRHHHLRPRTLWISIQSVWIFMTCTNSTQRSSIQQVLWWTPLRFKVITQIVNQVRLITTELSQSLIRASLTIQ
jgi:hypothetical protein